MAELSLGRMHSAKNEIFPLTFFNIRNFAVSTTLSELYDWAERNGLPARDLIVVNKVGPLERGKQTLKAAGITENMTLDTDQED